MVGIFVTSELRHSEANLSRYLAAGLETQCSLYKRVMCLKKKNSNKGTPQMPSDAQSGNR